MICAEFERMEEGYISYREREELLGKLENR